MLGHLGLDVTRLIRVSFGPFQLAELKAGDVEEVRTRILREQLGERLVADSGVDFSMPLLPRSPTPNKDPRPETTPRKPPSHAWRAHEEERPGKKFRRKFHGARRDDEKPRQRSGRTKCAPMCSRTAKAATYPWSATAQPPPREPPQKQPGKARQVTAPPLFARPRIRPAAQLSQRPPLMRVVGGSLRGRALAAPKSQSIRPTADRLREALFNILVHAYDDPISGRARARPVRRHRRARHRSAVARRRLCAVRRRRRGGARAAARERRDAWPRRRRPASFAATPPSSVRRTRSSRSRLSSSIRPTAKASPNRRSPRRARAVGSRRTRSSSSKRRSRPPSPRPKDLPSSNGARYDDTELIISAARAD